MPDPTIIPPPFTPDYPLSVDAGGLLLEGTHIVTQSAVSGGAGGRFTPVAGRTTQYRNILRMDQVRRLGAVVSTVFVLDPKAPRDPAVPLSDLQPTRTLVPTTVVWLEYKESILLAHPYDDVKRLWSNYLLHPPKIDPQGPGRWVSQ